MAESEEQKSLLRKVKEESEKVSLKLNIQKTETSVASGPVTSRQIDGKTRPPDLPLEKICMQIRKQQLELNTEQQTCSK